MGSIPTTARSRQLRELSKSSAENRRTRIQNAFRKRHPAGAKKPQSFCVWHDFPDARSFLRRPYGTTNFKDSAFPTLKRGAKGRCASGARLARFQNGYKLIHCLRAHKFPGHEKLLLGAFRRAGVHSPWRGLQHFRFCSLQKPGCQVAFSLRKGHLARCCKVDM